MLFEKQSENVLHLLEKIETADAILVGAAAGMSAACGFNFFWDCSICCSQCRDCCWAYIEVDLMNLASIAVLCIVAGLLISSIVYSRKKE